MPNYIDVSEIVDNAVNNSLPVRTALEALDSMLYNVREGAVTSRPSISGGSRSGGQIDGTPIGEVSASTGNFTNISTDRLSVGVASPDDDAIAEFRSSTQGVLLPRLSQSQIDAILSPPQGLLLYNATDDALNLYTGSSWVAITTA